MLDHPADVGTVIGIFVEHGAPWLSGLDTAERVAHFEVFTIRDAWHLSIYPDGQAPRRGVTTQRFSVALDPGWSPSLPHAPGVRDALDPLGLLQVPEWVRQEAKVPETEAPSSPSSWVRLDQRRLV